MTALCGGGTSSARPGFAATVAMTVPAIGALLNNVPTQWAVPFAAFLGIVNFEMGTFCTTDPPPEPTMTATDFVNMLNFTDVIDSGAAIAKFEDFVRFWAWPQLCACDSGAIPSTGAAPSAPSGMPAIDPTQLPSYPTGNPCTEYTFHGDASSATVLTVPAITALTGATFAQITATITNNLVGSEAVAVTVQYFNAATSFLGQLAISWDATHSPLTVSAAVPAGTTQVRIQSTNSGAPAANHLLWSVVIDLYCGTTPGGSGGSAPQPCVADPLLVLQVQQILAIVTLLQRYRVPFAYVPGASHSGLSGNGTLTIPPCLGVLLTLTTIPSSIGQESGSPNEFFEAGWFSWGNSTAFTERTWIHKNPQISFPAESAQYTRLGYSLSPGVVATIQELYAET